MIVKHSALMAAALMHAHGTALAAEFDRRAAEGLKEPVTNATPEPEPALPYYESRQVRRAAARRIMRQYR